MKVRGAGKVRKNLEKARKLAEKAAAERVHRAALEIEDRTVEIIDEKDIVDTGRLKESIQEEEVSQFVRRVGTDVEYAPIHEFGGKNTIARPYLQPAAEEVGARYPDLVKQGIAMELIKGGF